MFRTNRFINMRRNTQRSSYNNPNYNRYNNNKFKNTFPSQLNRFSNIGKNNRYNNTNSRAFNRIIPNYRRLPQKNNTIARNNNKTRRGRRNITNSNFANSTINKFNGKLDKMTEAISKLSINKPSNVFQRFKELRPDRLYSAMDMFKYSINRSFYGSNSVVCFNKIYSKCQIENDYTNTKKIIWYPYTYPCFLSLKDDLRVTANDVEVNALSNLYVVNKNSQSNQVTAYANQPTVLYGNVRLVAATLRITNVSSALTRGGTYSIYRLTDNFGYPLFYNENSPVNMFSDLPADLSDQLQTLVASNLEQLPQKLLFNGDEVGIIDEFNVIKGNDIFMRSDEYMGCDLVGSNKNCLSIDNFNPQGVNVKYIIDIPVFQTTQTYLLEQWQVFEVIPDPNTGLSNLGAKIPRLFTKQIFDMAQNVFPIHK